eukprot:277807-Prymnesium_polylepis.1
MVRQIVSHAPTHVKQPTPPSESNVSSAAAFAPLATSGVLFGIRDVAVPRTKQGPSAVAAKQVPSTEAASRALASATSGTPDVSSLAAAAAADRVAGRPSKRSDTIETYGTAAPPHLAATPATPPSTKLPPRSTPLPSQPAPSRAAPTLARDASVHSAFSYFDQNGSGYLDYRELRNALYMMGIDASLHGAAEILRQYDDNHDGKMDLS